MAPKLMDDSPSIVLLGGFDPRRFHPLWLRELGLLGAEEAKGAELKAMVPELTEWSTDWLVFQAIDNRLSVQAKTGAAAANLRDLALGILEVLDQTIVSALGINRAMHWDVGGIENWHKVGDVLAPKALWQPHMARRPGMRSLQIEDTPRADGLAGRVLVTVQPSSRLAHGIFVDVNNELRPPHGPDDPVPTPWAAKSIEDNWERLSHDAQKMAESVLLGCLS